MTIFGMKGKIENRTNKTLWIVENDSGRAIAHKLPPFKKSPADVDADGVKTVDGTPISDHDGWWKIGDTEWATVKGTGNSLTLYSFPSLIKKKVGDKEFGHIIYDQSFGWGE